MLSTRFLWLSTCLIAATLAAEDYPDFWSWKAACELAPRYDRSAERPSVSPLSFDQLQQQVEACIEVIGDELADYNAWKDANPPMVSYFHQKPNQFVPYLQKLVLPAGSQVAIHGDFHGDVLSINHFIETFAGEGYLDPDDPFKIKDPDFYILFLGDYTDRGWYGAEVIYTAARLKTTNPHQVFFVRGNHEDVRLNARYGFEAELQAKWPGVDSNQVYQLYNYLPLAIYLACERRGQLDFVQCCHGGIEIGFDPSEFLSADPSVAYTAIDRFMRADGLDTLFYHLGHDVIEACDITVTAFQNDIPPSTLNGFMWSDFIVDPTIPLGISRSRGTSIYGYGQDATRVLLDAWGGVHHQLRAVLRAHQHSSSLDRPMMQRLFNLDEEGHPDDAGLAKLWIGDQDIHREQASLLSGVLSVTFSVSPGISYPVPYDAFGLLSLAWSYDKWRLTAYRTQWETASTP